MSTMEPADRRADGPAVDPGRTFNINEKTYAGYAQANYAFDAGSVTIDGELGLRAVRTETETNGTLFSTTGPTAVCWRRWLWLCLHRISSSWRWSSARGSISR